MISISDPGLRERWRQFSPGKRIAPGDAWPINAAGYLDLIKRAYTGIVSDTTVSGQVVFAGIEKPAGLDHARFITQLIIDNVHLHPSLGLSSLAEDYLRHILRYAAHGHGRQHRAMVRWEICGE